MCTYILLFYSRNYITFRSWCFQLPGTDHPVKAMYTCILLFYCENQLLQHWLILSFSVFLCQLLRGFPDRLVERIREQPSGALLATMLKRQKLFSPADFYLQRVKGDYVASRLPRTLEVVGSKAPINNYWLFPVVAVSADNFVFCRCEFVIAFLFWVFLYGQHL